MYRSVLLSTLFLLSTTPVWAGTGHTLFNPTPDNEMRSMTTERSSKADGPFSLDAGHFQIETTFYNYGHNDDCISGTCTKARQNNGGGFTTLRVGLTDNVDFQLVGDLYRQVIIKDKTNGTKESRQGYGDTLARLKINLIGNDPASKFSLGIMPFVKIPTNQDNLSNNEYEGGLELPFNVNFEGGWNIGGMTAVNGVKQLDSTGYDPAYVNALVLGKGITDKVSVYTEFYTYRADQSGALWQNSLDFGTTYSVTDNFKLDANAYVGVSEAADDLNLFIGGSYRF